MEKLFVGLLLHELILMSLGIVLFIILLILLVIFAIRNKSLKALLLFFFVPIIMIAYPSIQSIKVKDFLEIVSKKAEDVSKDPLDTARVNTLERMLKDFDPKRLEKNPVGLTTFAKAYSVLERYETADQLINQALELDKQNMQALETKVTISAGLKKEQKFEHDIAILKTQLNNQKDIQSLAETLSGIRPPVYIEAPAMLTLAEALNAVGEQGKADTLIENVLREKPDHVNANLLKQQIATQHQTKPVLSEATRNQLNKSVLLEKRTLMMRESLPQ